MFQVWFTNFGYAASREGDTVEDAKKIAQKAQFQAQIIDLSTGTTVATYCPLRGFRWWDRSYAA